MAATRQYINIIYTEGNKGLVQSSGLIPRVAFNDPKRAELLKPAMVNFNVTLPEYPAEQALTDVQLDNLSESLLAGLANHTKRLKKDGDYQIRLFLPARHDIRQIEALPNVKAAIEAMQVEHIEVCMLHNDQKVQWVNFQYVKDNSAVSRLINQDSDESSSSSISKDKYANYTQVKVINALDKMGKEFCQMQEDEGFITDNPEFNLEPDQYFVMRGLQLTAIASSNQAELWLDFGLQTAYYGKPVNRQSAHFPDGKPNLCDLPARSIMVKVQTENLDVIEETMDTPSVADSGLSSPAISLSALNSPMLSPSASTARFAKAMYKGDGSMTPLSRRLSSPPGSFAYLSNTNISSGSQLVSALAGMHLTRATSLGSISDQELYAYPEVSPDVLAVQAALLDAVSPKFSEHTVSTTDSSSSFASSSTPAPQMSPSASPPAASPSIGSSSQVVMPNDANSVPSTPFKYWILVVDDAAVNLKLISKNVISALSKIKSPMSKEVGILVCESSAEAALFSLNYPNACLLVFMDYQMPTWSGDLGTRIIRLIDSNNAKEQRDIPVWPTIICLSANDSTEVKKNVLDADQIFDSFLLKPTNVNMIIEVIKQAFAKKALYTVELPDFFATVSSNADSVLPLSIPATTVLINQGTKISVPTYELALSTVAKSCYTLIITPIALAQFIKSEPIASLASTLQIAPSANVLQNLQSQSAMPASASTLVAAIGFFAASASSQVGAGVIQAQQAQQLESTTAGGNLAAMASTSP
jgi:CheY-like chemotaxis protein